MYTNGRDFDSCVTFTITNKQTGKAWQVRYEAEITRKAKNSPTVLLKPGETKTIPFEFEAALRFVPDPGGKSQKYLPPGRYRVIVALNFSSYEGSKIRYWDGQITSAPLDIEVNAKAGGSE